MKRLRRRWRCEESILVEVDDQNLEWRIWWRLCQFQLITAHFKPKNSSSYEELLKRWRGENEEVVKMKRWRWRRHWLKMLSRNGRIWDITTVPINDTLRKIWRSCRGEEEEERKMKRWRIQNGWRIYLDKASMINIRPHSVIPFVFKYSIFSN